MQRRAAVKGSDAVHLDEGAQHPEQPHPRGPRTRTVGAPDTARDTLPARMAGTWSLVGPRRRRATPVSRTRPSVTADALDLRQATSRRSPSSSLSSLERCSSLYRQLAGWTMPVGGSASVAQLL